MPVIQTDKIKVIKMDVDDWPENVTKRKCFVVGYGYHRVFGRSGRLHGGQVVLGKGPNPYENCPAAYHHTRKFLWSYNNESEPLCFGDSGAPIVCDGKTHGIGVLSFPCYQAQYNIDCSELYVDAYVMLRDHLPWIKEHLSCAPDCSVGSSFFKVHSSTYLLWCILTLLYVAIFSIK
ncbi:hypothetical protein O3M35_005051 [Rhynocoris fuscipes]|uniref:Peptidase S1 domain-containing protein n=1 Tax=Rhynocoris fuscipes TaxID=488301 RepID=A0AAW1DMS3_9HEMI